jgi:hypothetical protein
VSGRTFSAEDLEDLADAGLTVGDDGLPRCAECDSVDFVVVISETRRYSQQWNPRLKDFVREADGSVTHREEVADACAECGIEVFLSTWMVLASGPDA